MRLFMTAMLLVWLLAVWYLGRARLHFFRYMLGIIGCFAFGVYFISGPAVEALQWIVAQVTGLLGRLTGMFTVYPDLKFIAISANERYLSFYIDYECSGFIEILAFESLLVFYPLYHWWERVWIGVSCAALILATNIGRIFLICLLVFLFGEGFFYPAHTIIGRLFFYVISILIYFYVFTKPHINRQKVKGYDYASSHRENS